MKKKISLVVALVLAVVLSAGLVACGGKSDEEVIREGVSAEFDAIKNMDDEAMNEILSGFNATASLSQFGIDDAEFCRAWLTGFDYTIDDVAVDGENATVTTTITVRSLASAMTSWQDEITALAQDEEFAALDSEEQYSKIGEMLMDAMNAAPMDTNTIKLPYVLNNNTWEPGAGFETELANAFASGLV